MAWLHITSISWIKYIESKMRLLSTYIQQSTWRKSLNIFHSCGFILAILTILNFPAKLFCCCILAARLEEPKDECLINCAIVHTQAINELFCGWITEKFENKQVLDYKIEGSSGTEGGGASEYLVLCNEGEKLQATSNGTYMDGYSHPESM